MGSDCTNGECAKMSWEELSARPPEGFAFTSIYSRRDGIVDWRACIDPSAEAVEVNASHVGMALDPRVIDAVLAALLPRAAPSVVEVDRGEIA
jgi:triacylglycerol lipase